MPEREWVGSQLLTFVMRFASTKADLQSSSVAEPINVSVAEHQKDDWASGLLGLLELGVHNCQVLRKEFLLRKESCILKKR